MPYRDLIKYVFIAKRQGYYIARQSMIKNGYRLQEIAIMLSHRLKQIEIEEEKEILNQAKRIECKIYEWPVLIAA